MEAETALTAPGKVYTGREMRRYSLNLMGRRLNFYENSGISYGKYDRMTQTKTWAPLGDRGLPILWQRETIREYETAPLSLDPEQAETMLKDRLAETLAARLDEGKVLRQDFQSRREGDTLTVTLLAQCSEQIGRTKEWGAPGDAAGPLLPDTEEPLEGTNANDRTDREH
jgi:similar to stage IV sporulation protein